MLKWIREKLAIQTFKRTARVVIPKLIQQLKNCGVCDRDAFDFAEGISKLAVIYRDFDFDSSGKMVEWIEIILSKDKTVKQVLEMAEKQMQQKQEQTA